MWWNRRFGSQLSNNSMMLTCYYGRKSGMSLTAFWKSIPWRIQAFLKAKVSNLYNQSVPNKVSVSREQAAYDDVICPLFSCKRTWCCSWKQTIPAPKKLKIYTGYITGSSLLLTGWACSMKSKDVFCHLFQNILIRWRVYLTVYRTFPQVVFHEVGEQRFSNSYRRAFPEQNAARDFQVILVHHVNC